MELKSDLHKYIDTINDGGVLKAIHTLLKKHFQSDVVGYKSDGKSITKKDLLKRIAIAEKQHKEGKYISIEELEKESESW